MATELDRLLELLRDDPERRAALRRELLADQPDLHAELAGLAAAQREAAEGLATLTRRVGEFAEAQRQTAEGLATLAGRVDELAEALTALARRFDALVTEVHTLTEQISTLTTHVDWLRGDGLERKYREKGHVLLGRIATRLRTVPPDAIEELLDDAVQAGQLTEDEADDARLVDAVYRGRIDGEAVYLVMEVSWGLGDDDVHRARKRADLFAKTGIPAVAVAAGRRADPDVLAVASGLDVWVVTNGRAQPPAADRAGSPDRRDTYPGLTRHRSPRWTSGRSATRCSGRVGCLCRVGSHARCSRRRCSLQPARPPSSSPPSRRTAAAGGGAAPSSPC